MSIMNTQQIMDILPHRSPFLLIDTVEELEPGVKCVAKKNCLLYTSPSPRDRQKSRMPSSA